MGLFFWGMNLEQQVLVSHAIIGVLEYIVGDYLMGVNGF